MRHPLRLALAILAVATALVATASPAATHSVAVGPGNSFSPQTVTIDVGDTVTWTSGGFHTVKSDDGTSFLSDQSGAAFTFSHTFNAAGTFGYHCLFHGSPGGGMFGTVVVQASGGGEPGTLRFTLAAYTVNEGAGSASIGVERVGGDDGAVSVQRSATAGTATAGQDFTAGSGSLSWADNEDGAKTFAVPIANDTLVEGNETVQLTLASPTGGAVLDPARQSAALTIQDNDSPPGGTPAAPSNLTAAAESVSEVELHWTDNATNETGFSIETRTVSGAYEEVASAGPNATAAVVPDLDPSTFYLFRVRAMAGSSNSAYSNEAGAATLGDVAPCVAGPQTLCLNNSRFRVEVEWRIPDGTTGAGQAVPLASAPDSGLVYFFGPSNIELLIKVLNACVPSLGNRYWTFFAATTNVELAIVVTDTQTGRTKGYFNPLNRSAPPVQDVSAFATCP